LLDAVVSDVWIMLVLSCVTVFLISEFKLFSLAPDLHLTHDIDCVVCCSKDPSAFVIDQYLFYTDSLLMPTP